MSMGVGSGKEKKQCVFAYPPIVSLTCLFWIKSIHVPDLPTCLLCVCLTGSVYCEEVDPEMTSVPALPKETNYLYARYNKIKKITAKDFRDVGEFFLTWLALAFSLTALFCWGNKYNYCGQDKGLPQRRAGGKQLLLFRINPESTSPKTFPNVKRHDIQTAMWSHDIVSSSVA